MKISQLDEYSQAVAQRILARFPEWEVYAAVDVKNAEPPSLLIEIPAPPEANVDHPLTITTENEEITVGFDYIHVHFNEWTSEDGMPFGIEAALSFIEQILEEREAAVSWWQGEQWCGSSTIKIAEEPMPFEGLPSFDRVRIRSWRGAQNRG